MQYGVIAVVALIVLQLTGIFQLIPTAGAAIPTPTDTTGVAVVTVSDPAADMGKVRAVNMVMSRIEMQDSSGQWIMVMNTNRNYELLELNRTGQQAFAGASELQPGVYNRIRVRVENVMITNDVGQQVNAQLPSNEIIIDGPFTIQAKTMTALNLDFSASNSLETDGSGQYQFRSQVQVRERLNAQVQPGASTNGSFNVGVTGGQQGSDVTVKVDASGNAVKQGGN